jgi:uncharacterized phage protein (TIGR02218 family)
MTYASVETSENSAQKIKLFDISFSSHHWYLTNHTETVNFNATLWLPAVGIAHDQIPDALNLDNGKVGVQLAHTHEIADLLKLGSPGGNLNIDIYHGHLGGDFIQVWRGRLVERETDYPNINLITDSRLASARRLAAGLVVSVACPVDLYGPECGVSKAAFKVDSAVTAIDGLTLTLSSIGAYADKWFLGGLAEWPHPTLVGVTMTASILAHEAGTITIAMPAPTIAVGTVLSLYPNCNHELGGDCANKFNNTINHRGMPYINGRNPFGTFRLY